MCVLGSEIILLGSISNYWVCVVLNLHTWHLDGGHALADFIVNQVQFFVKVALSLFEMAVPAPFVPRVKGSHPQRSFATLFAIRAPEAGS
jgi:hypothetical protein